MKHGSQRARFSQATLDAPFHWNKLAERAGFRPRVFCLSLGDWLDLEIPIDWLTDLLDVVRLCGMLDWLLLTKRPQNWHERLTQAYADAHLRGKFELAAWISAWLEGAAPHNVWLGVSAGVSVKANLETPARIHFLSCEPMLKPLDDEMTEWLQKFDWIIFGGESDKDARSTHLAWIRHGIQFCKFYDIACFVKQLGSKPIDNNSVIKLNDWHGGEWDEWPADLRIREFPALTADEFLLKV
jgi:protein gp37